MARITAEALDATERAKLGGIRPSGDQRRPTVNVRPAAPLLSLALLVGGACSLLAPGGLPFPAFVLAIAAVAAGGWLARGPGDGSAEERARLARREAELNRVLVTLALRGGDGAARGPHEPARAPESDEHGPDGGVHPQAGRRALHAVGGAAGDDESLDPAADEGAGGLD